MSPPISLQVHTAASTTRFASATVNVLALQLKLAPESIIVSCHPLNLETLEWSSNVATIVATRLQELFSYRHAANCQLWAF